MLLSALGACERSDDGTMERTWSLSLAPDATQLLAIGHSGVGPFGERVPERRYAVRTPPKQLEPGGELCSVQLAELCFRTERAKAEDFPQDAWGGTAPASPDRLDSCGVLRPPAVGEHLEGASLTALVEDRVTTLVSQCASGEAASAPLTGGVSVESVLADPTSDGARLFASVGTAGDSVKGEAVWPGTVVASRLLDLGEATALVCAYRRSLDGNLFDDEVFRGRFGNALGRLSDAMGELGLQPDFYVEANTGSDTRSRFAYEVDSLLKASQANGWWVCGD